MDKAGDVKPYDHVYLSPHFDDAALSCGGAIYQQRRAGEAVLVVTICAAPPEPAAPLSSYARAFHEAMGTLDDLVAMRRREDQAALERLGVDAVWLDFQDSIYRRPPGGNGWFYTSIAGVFGSVHPDDRPLADAIAAAIRAHAPGGSQTTLYAPLTVGGHVDHQLAHQAAWMLREQGWRVVFYEEYPYADPAYRLPFGVENAATLKATLATLQAARLAPHIVRLSDDAVQARIDSVRAYRSQVPLLFGDDATMVARLRAYTMEVDGQGPAERFWVPGCVENLT